jgi:hypothetical protein
MSSLLALDLPVYSTDPELQRAIHFLYNVAPVIARQFDAVINDIDIGNCQFNIQFPDGMSAEQKTECWSRITHSGIKAGMRFE